jgi:hypothetical protein
MKVQSSKFKVQKAPGRFCRLNFELRASALLAMVLASRIASACPVCFGDPTAPSAKGMNAAIWFLLAMVGFVQVGFVALFVTFWRRSREMRRRRESFHVLEGGLR